MKAGAGAERRWCCRDRDPGMADMKPGDVMNREQADPASPSWRQRWRRRHHRSRPSIGYKCRYGMRSIEEGITAINEGCVVLGFGFMDKEELGPEARREPSPRNTGRA